MDFKDKFKKGMKDLFKDVGKLQTIFSVVGGQNLLPGDSNICVLISEEKEHGQGVVSINKKLYYFLGSHKEQASTRSAGKAAAGAIVGGVLTGGIGAIAGAALGGRKKDDSTFWIDLVDYETKQEFSIQIKERKSTKGTITKLKSANPKEIGLE